MLNHFEPFHLQLGVAPRKRHTRIERNRMEQTDWWIANDLWSGSCCRHPVPYFEIVSCEDQQLLDFAADGDGDAESEEDHIE